MAECGLLDLATCLPQKLFEYLITILNAPLQPLLSSIKDLLSEPIQLQLFMSLWVIIVYMLSMFYAFLIMYSGFSFIIAGHDVARRENAKEWLKNIIIMIILIQASFFIYQLAVDLSSIMTSSTLSLIDNNFFLLTIDNISNIGLEFLYAISYILILLLTLIILTLRYAIVAIGIILFPLAIFAYFIPVLRSYGVWILNLLGISVFITFLDAIVLIGFSKIIEISIFANMKIIVMISAFGLIDVIMFFLIFFSIIKGAFSIGTKIAVMAAKFVA